ncbi:hypothetical protein ABIB99_004951 [Bradyrhizobium sp. LA6.1]
MTFGEKMLRFFGRADVMNAVVRRDKATYERLLLEHISK